MKWLKLIQRMQNKFLGMIFNMETITQQMMFEASVSTKAKVWCSEQIKLLGVEHKTGWLFKIVKIKYPDGTYQRLLELRDEYCLKKQNKKQTKVETSLDDFIQNEFITPQQYIKCCEFILNDPKPSYERFLKYLNK